MTTHFTFFESYYESVKDLDATIRAEFYDAIFQYALYDIEADIKNPIVKALFILTKPNLDKSKEKAKAGQKGGKQQANSKQESENDKQTVSKAEANSKQTVSDKEKEKEKEKEKGKGERSVEKEDAHTPFSKNEEIKTETKQEINPSLKNLIASSSKSENKPTEIINFYRDNISNKYEDIQEQASYNQIMIKNYDIGKMLTGLKNYARYLQVSKGKPIKLFFFVRDGIYIDYQVEAPVTMGKNSVIVPIELVGKVFVVDGESIEFESNGYNKVGKDWKVTNAKNVEEMVNLVRGNVAWEY